MRKILLCFLFCLTAFQARANDPFADWTGKTIGVQLGTSGDTLATASPLVQTERYNKAGDAVQSLLNGKIDAVLIDDAPAKVFAAQNPALAVVQKDFEKEDYAFAVAKENATLTKQIDRAVQTLRDDGTLDKIAATYLATPENERVPYQSPANVKYDGELRIATNATFPPYEYYHDGQIVGIDIDIARAVADLLGKKAVITDMEFDAIIPAVVSGKADMGAAGMTVTEERRQNVDFSVPYTRAQQVFLVRGKASAGTGMKFSQRFETDFIKDARWKYLADGLKNTLIITALAVSLGIALGGLIAVVCASHDINGSFKAGNFICRAYLAVIRGTPVMIQLLIMYYVVFASVGVNKMLVAILAFGLNSAAYVAEIIRSGIASVDSGQLEAGRSLGFSFFRTMRHIILPQAFKNVLPALANEFIVLLKETSVCGYIGLTDLTRGGDIIRSITYDAFLPLASVALIYFSMVFALTRFTTKLEKRLKRNER